MNTKIKCFNQIIIELITWYNQINPPDKENDLGYAKLMKLLFFICGVNKENHLFDIFNFQAWQYGHVEPDIYDYMKEEKCFNRFHLDYEPKEIILEPSLKLKIHNNIKLLKEKNPKLITCDMFKLVEISQYHWSWKLYYNKMKGKRYVDMDKEILIYESKYFI